jgi:hypothetical protein
MLQNQPFGQTKSDYADKDWNQIPFFTYFTLETTVSGSCDTLRP